jgi:hypothetical protein
MGKGTKKKFFDELLASVREGGAILRRQERAKRGDRKAFERVLARVPAAESEPLDRIDARADTNRARAKRPKPLRKMLAGGGSPSARRRGR